MINEIDALPHLLLYGDYAAIANLGEDNKRVLTELIALTFDQDDLVGWRAAVAMGHVGARIAEVDPEFVRGILRRLMWMMNDESGSIGWRAPQTMGAIIAHRPELFSEFIPILVAMLDAEETHFYPGVLWAIGYIAEHNPERVHDALPTVLNYLRDPSPKTRGMAAWCVGKFGNVKTIPALQTLFDDSARVSVFVADGISEYQVGNLAREAIRMIKDGKS